MELNKNALYSKVFLWLGIGLLISFFTGYYVSFHLDNAIFAGFAMISIIFELIIAFVMGICLHKLSSTACTVLYLIYCLLSGFNFSVIFITYKVQSIMFVFLITSVIFLLFAFIGKVSKVDFRKMGIYLLFMLLGIVIVSIINIFLQSSSLAFGLSVFGVMLFMGFILYDMKMLDTLEEVFGTDKAAVYGAFQLYIDFINLFLDILRLLGKSKD